MHILYLLPLIFLNLARNTFTLLESDAHLPIFQIIERRLRYAHRRRCFSRLFLSASILNAVPDALERLQLLHDHVVAGLYEVLIFSEDKLCLAVGLTVRCDEVEDIPRNRLIFTESCQHFYYVLVGETDRCSCIN